MPSCTIELFATNLELQTEFSNVSQILVAFRVVITLPFYLALKLRVLNRPMLEKM